jgi:radical SAM-linked protein
MPPAVARYRVTFAKTEHMRFTGHLDLQRTWERMIRRAELPVDFSRGYHPRPRIEIASALPLGFTAEAEIVDLYLETPLPAGELRERLTSVAPPGVRIAAAEEIPSGAPAVQTRLVAAQYRVTLEPDCSREAMSERVAALLRAERVLRERKGKPYDLRPLIRSIEVTEEAPGSVVLVMELDLAEGRAGRPDEVLAALGVDPLSAKICRTQIFLAPT